MSTSRPLAMQNGNEARSEEIAPKSSPQEELKCENPVGGPQRAAWPNKIATKHAARAKVRKSPGANIRRAWSNAAAARLAAKKLRREETAEGVHR